MTAPPTNPSAVGRKPPRPTASSTSSNESAEISTPPPKDMTNAITRVGIATK